MSKINNNLTELLEQAKEGKLSSDEIEYVAQQINDNTDSLYTLIHILGRAEAIQYRNKIEPYLNYPENPLIAQIALKSLCTYWDLTKDYLDELTTFINGVEWDDFDDVRISAIGIAGEYLRLSPNSDLLFTLIDLFENLTTSTRIKSTDDPQLLRSCAYHAISRALGMNYDQIPNTKTIMQQLEQNTLDLSLIQQAKKMAKF